MKDTFRHIFYEIHTRTASLWLFMLQIDNILIGILICAFAAHAWFTFYDGFSEIILYMSIGILTLPSLASLSIITSAIYLTLSAIILLSAEKPVARYTTLLPNALSLLAGFGVYAFVWIPADNLIGTNVYICLICIVTGTSAILLSMLHLRRSFSVTPQARGLVKSGPYLIVRHPMYVANIISIFGLSMLVDSLLGYMLFFICTCLQIARSKFEERLLAEVFPDYEDYRRDVPGYFPKISSSFLKITRSSASLMIVVLCACSKSAVSNKESAETKLAQKCSEWYAQSQAEEWFTPKQAAELLDITTSDKPRIGKVDIYDVKACEKLGELDQKCHGLLFSWQGYDGPKISDTAFIRGIESLKGCVYLIGLKDVCSAQKGMSRKGVTLSESEKTIMHDCIENDLKNKRVQFLRPAE